MRGSSIKFDKKCFNNYAQKNVHKQKLHTTLIIAHVQSNMLKQISEFKQTEG